MGFSFFFSWCLLPSHTTRGFCRQSWHSPRGQGVLSACRINTSCWRGVGPLLASSGEPTEKKKLRPCAACKARGSVSRRVWDGHQGGTRVAQGWEGGVLVHKGSLGTLWEGDKSLRASQVPRHCPSKASPP